VAGPGSDREISGFSIDTRTLSSGDLFIAIRGDRFDGNAYAPEAVDEGRGWGDCERPDPDQRDRACGTPLIVSSDTIAALQALAIRVRRDSGAAVVAVTGSAGSRPQRKSPPRFWRLVTRCFATGEI
jgi:UDP-N-acetylmuramoyl-tripeptide--D-alanyl-D-alanine ligase